ncbi:hypothetical protein F0562_003986 [Nyssa sinensis]|uniref:Reverse transcriptase n=1 Tax=Nyssa sinensis TaxID=561372 RepID=A0A5J5C0V2_9ASTE|nr:hypothetical protein F0562_003986 [Nyssa sinensis]
MDSKTDGRRSQAPRKKKFGFEAMWTCDGAYEDNIRAGLTSRENRQESTLQFVFDSVQKCRLNLLKWSRSDFGRTHCQLAEKQQILQQLKELHPSEDTKHEIGRVCAQIDEWLIIDNVLVAYELHHFIKGRSRGRVAYASLKLEMSKAYNKVEWGYLRQFMLTLGFAER